MGFKYVNGIPTATGLHIEGNTPADDRLVVTLYTDLVAIVYKYDGMVVYVTENKNHYSYDEATNTWSEFGQGGEGVYVPFNGSTEDVTLGTNNAIRAGRVALYEGTGYGAGITASGNQLTFKTVQLNSFNFNTSGLTSNRNFYVPNANGTLVLSVNGNQADSSGNVTVTIPNGTWGTITGTLSAQTDLQTALNAKQVSLVSGTNIKTVGGQSILGSGNVTVSATTTWGAITGALSAQTDLQTALNAKVNVSGNTFLSGTTIRIANAATNGALGTDNNLTWVPTTRELGIGQQTTGSTTNGRLNIASTAFQLSVQDNIASGNASFVFNSGQNDALSFKDKSGNIYMTFRTVSGNTSVILRQREIYDESIFYPLTKRQAVITSAGAGVEVKGTDALGNNLIIPFAVDTMVGIFEATLVVKNATASQVIAAKIKAVAKRVSGAITVASSSLEILSNHTSITGFQAGIKSTDNNTLYFFFTPASGDSTSYTGAFTEIKYSIN